MAGHWRTLLEGIIANPHSRLSQLPLLTVEAERHTLLAEWNRVPREIVGVRDTFIEIVRGSPRVEQAACAAVVALIYGKQQAAALPVDP